MFDEIIIIKRYASLQAVGSLFIS